MGLLGAALAQERAGGLVEARRRYEQVLRIAPRNRDALNLLGRLFALGGELEQGMRLLRRGLAFAPNFAGARINLCWALLQAGRPKEAAAQAETGLASAPGDPMLLHNRGIALHRLQRPADGLACFEQALAAGHPQPADLLADGGLALRELDRPQAAMQRYEAALALRPDAAILQFARAQCALATGDLATGWEGFEHRLSGLPGGTPAWFAQHRLQPGEAVAGQTILLRAEQGFGDSIQFCRYARLLTEAGARVLTEAPAPLHRLLQTLHGVTAIVEPGDELPPFDR